MIRSAYEERVATEIEAELRARDTAWSRRVDALVAELGGQRRVHPVLPIVCLLGGIAFLLAGRLGWMSLELATLSGASTPSIRLAFTVALGTVVLTSMVLLGRVAYDRRGRVSRPTRGLTSGIRR
jgi:hypothetical protein